MKRALGLGLMLISLSLPLIAAETSHRFFLAADVHIGDVCIARGYYDVSWIKTSGSQVQLAIQAKGQKPITISARRVGVKHSEAGVTTFVDNGVTYLQDFHTPNDTFILSGAPNGRR